MNQLLLHPLTAKQLDTIVKAKPQALLITGKTGSGKTTVARYLAGLLIGEPALNHPYVLFIDGVGQGIGINDIRHIRQFLGKRTTGQSAVRRVIVIDGAHTMTTEAQNALLKMLEEPPADTVFILTASDLVALRPTIRSRAQQLQILPVSLEQAQSYFDDPDVERLFSLSSGLVGLLASLLANETDHMLISLTKS